MTTPSPDSEKSRHAFPKAVRLLSPAAFAQVYRSRRSVSDDCLILYFLANETPCTRLGVSVSRKVGNAVRRNRWKRLLREAFRLARHEFPTGLDLITIPRTAEPPTLTVLRASLMRLARRAEKRARGS